MALRDTRILSSGFSARFAERLALEPTVLSPVSIPQQAAKRPAYRAPLSIAASLCAVSLVGWLAFQSFGPDGQQIAQNKKTLEAAKSQLLAAVPMPGGVNDYLLAHCARLRPRAFVTDTYFIDIGTPADYALAQSTLARVVATPGPASTSS